MIYCFLLVFKPSIKLHQPFLGSFLFFFRLCSRHPWNQMIEGFVLHFGNLNYWFDLRYSCLFHSSIYRWVFKEKKKILPGKKKKNWKLKIKVFWQKLKRIISKGFLENTSPKIKLKIKSVESFTKFFVWIHPQSFVESWIF